MRSLGLILVALAAASAYGLDRKDDIAGAIAYVADGGSIAAIEASDEQPRQEPSRDVPEERLASEPQVASLSEENTTRSAGI